MPAKEFLHGTSHVNAAAIIREGFRRWYSIDENGQRCSSSAGALGDGIYITTDPGTALYFGPVVLRVSLKPATQLLDAEPRPEMKTIAGLKREFGHEILSMAPRKALPRNKRLKRNEAIALFRFHYHEGNLARPPRKTARLGADSEVRSQTLFNEMIHLLKRHGFDGFGEMKDWNGIVVFGADKVAPSEIVVDIPRNDYEGDRFFELFYFGDGPAGVPKLTTLDAIHRHYPLKAPSQLGEWLDHWARESGQTQVITGTRDPIPVGGADGGSDRL